MSERPSDEALVSKIVEIIETILDERLAARCVIDAVRRWDGPWYVATWHEDGAESKPDESGGEG